MSKKLNQGTDGGVSCSARQLHCDQAVHWLQVLMERESENVAIEYMCVTKIIVSRKDLPEAAQFLDQFVLQARQSKMVRPPCYNGLTIT